jgi:hypothetical protein
MMKSGREPSDQVRSAGYRPRMAILLFVLLLGDGTRGVRADGGVLSFDYAKDIHSLIENYCLKCHGPEKPKGGVNLSTFTNIACVKADPRTWQTVLTQLRERNMPPQNKPQPKTEERTRLIDWIEVTLDSIDDSQLARDPGRKIIHRLSQFEYNNTVRDLLGVDTRPADKFPPDGGGGGGFDNNADTLFIPPILMEKYLVAAGEILESAKPGRIFIAKPAFLMSKRSAARQILEYFAHRAFRRPVEKDELEDLLGLYDRAGKRGENHESGVKLALKAILVSPNFLFRIEANRSTTEPYRINDYELATRLSYFLWSSMPDDNLLAVAAQKRLHEPKVLEAEIQRMLQSPKAKAFAENFATQWLRVKELKTSAQPDTRRFPEFTAELRDAMYAEPVEFFHSLLRGNRSLLEFIDSDYTFVNADLARHYGIEGVEGRQFQRVKFSDRNRGGLLGMAGVLTLTSYPLRTSPVLRGKWVLEEILGSPPPPPPPLIKSLPRDDKPKDGLTLRQRLEKHREDVTCAACHKRMDPLGFGLENFDAIGRWRTEIADQPVDASGEMTTGEKFSGPVELKQILLDRKNEFARNVIEKMLAYALGRGLEIHDMPTVREITKTLAKDGYHAGTLVVEIVKSYPFQYRRNNPIQLTLDSK